MKTFLKILLAILVGIGLSACRVDEDPDEGEDSVVDEEKEVLVEEEESSDVDIDHEHELIDAIEIDPYWDMVLYDDPGAVFDRALKTCTDIEEGLLISDVVLDMMNEGVPRLSAEHMVEASIFIVCPEFESNYEAYILSNRE